MPTPSCIGYLTTYQVSISSLPHTSLPHTSPLPPLGVFNARYEATDGGGSWEGAIQYSVSAVLVVPEAANDRVSVSSNIMPVSATCTILYNLHDIFLCPQCISL